MEEPQLLKILLWGLGACITGFLFLAGWIWTIMGKVSEKVSYDWLENQFQKSINLKFDAMQTTLLSIKDALVGDFKNKGLITKQEESAKEITIIKERCTKNHG